MSWTQTHTQMRSQHFCDRRLRRVFSENVQSKYVSTDNRTTPAGRQAQHCCRDSSICSFGVLAVGCGVCVCVCFEALTAVNKQHTQCKFTAHKYLRDNNGREQNSKQRRCRCRCWIVGTLEQSLVSCSSCRIRVLFAQQPHSKCSKCLVKYVMCACVHTRSVNVSTVVVCRVFRECVCRASVSLAEITILSTRALSGFMQNNSGWHALLACCLQVRRHTAAVLFSMGPRSAAAV